MQAIVLGRAALHTLLLTSIQSIGESIILHKNIVRNLLGRRRRIFPIQVIKSTSLKILMEFIRLSACHWDRIAVTAAWEGTDHDLLTISGTVLQDHLWTNQHLCFRALLFNRVWILYWRALHQLVATCLKLSRLVRCWNLAPLLVFRGHILLLCRCAVHVINGTLCHSAKVILMLLTLLNLLLKLVGGRVSTNPLHWLPLGANA